MDSNPELKSKFVPLKVGDISFSPDFRSVAYKGVQADTFTLNQAYAMECFFNAHQSGHSEIHQSFILERLYGEKLDSMGEVSLYKNIFREHPLWGELIIKGKRKGMFRINFDWIPEQN
ncbi:MAG: hypothetical protein ACXWRE_10795 [Pseudobdellovibrionaceae bacterium]